MTLVEALEPRTVLNASITISAANVLTFASDPAVDNVVTVSYDATSSTYTISDFGDTGAPPPGINIDVTNNTGLPPSVIVNGSGTPTVTITNLSALSTAALNFNLGPQTDTINVQSINDPTTLDSTSTGVTTYNVGNGSNGVQGIANTLTLQDSTGTAAVTIDDSADTTGRTVALAADNGADTGSITGLAPATIQFVPTNLHSLGINGGSGGTSTPNSGNQITVAGTPANVTTTLNAGAGISGANVTVQATGSAGALNVVFQNGSNNVLLGDSASGVQGLLGPVSLSATGGVFTTLVDDSANPTAETVTLTDTSITGLAPTPIAFAAAPTPGGTIPAALVVMGGSGNNTYTVTDTSPDLLEQLTPGSGTNAVNISGTSSGAGGALAIAGANGTNAVTLSNLAGLAGQVLINPAGASGTTSLTIDDSSDTTGVSPTLSAMAGGGRNVGQLVGLTPMPILYALDGSVTQVILNTGSGDDTLTVDFGGAGGNPIPLPASGDGLQFNAGAGSNALALQGALSSGPFASESVTSSLPGTGHVALDSSMIAFSGLSLINDTAAATNFAFAPLSSPQGPSGASPVVNLGNGPILGSLGGSGNGVQTATIFDGSGSTPAAFASINFANKTNASLGQNSLPYSAITFNVINPTPAAGLATLKVITSSSDGSDTTNVNATPAGVATSVTTPGQSNAITVLATGLAVSPATFSATGGAANSTLNVNAGGTGPVSVSSTAVAVSSQIFSYASEQAINFTNVQEQILSTTSATVSATQGTALTNAVVGSFINADPYVGSGHFAITISWGDGTTSTGTAVPSASGTGFDVQGSHTYTSSGTFPIAVTIATTNTGGTVNVGSVPVTTQSFSNTVTATINSTANVAAAASGFLSIHSTGPITAINVSPFGEFQVFFQGFQNGQFFASDQPIGDAGILIRLPDGTVDGFNLNGRVSAASATNSIPFHPISQALSPDGTTITTVFDNSTDNNSLGIHYQVTQVITYRTGDPFFTATYSIVDQGTQPLNLDVFQAGDLFLADSDQGVGFYNPQTGGIGGVDATGQFKIFFQPNSAVGVQPTNYQEAGFNTIWSVIGGGPTSNFNNTALLPTTSPPFNNDPNYIDNGAGLEWKSLTVPVGSPTTISAFTAFGNVNVVGPVTNPQVTNTNDSGAGSLRDAILMANAAASGSSAQMITFNIPGAGAHVISLTSPLPHLTRPVIIDGTTQPGFAGIPLIEINGAGAGAAADGLVLDGGNSTIRGLAINRFTGSGIVLETAGGNTIANNYIGADSSGASGPGNGLDGIEIVGSGSTGDSIVNNLIVGNAAGVYIFGGASGNTLAGNHIGIGFGSSTAALPNQVGVAIADSPNNVIGGPTVAMANVIADNAMSGVLIFNSALGASNAATGNVVASNVIMLNGQNGVYILNASGNIVGMTAGTATSPGTASPLTTGGNIIAGNGFAGVQISVDNVPGSGDQAPSGAAASGNVVQNNLVTGNQHDGLYVFNASSNILGNAAGGSGNTVVSSGFSGVHLEGPGATGNVVTGDSIQGSAKFGVQIDDGSGNTIGGTGAAANQLVDNGQGGIQFLSGGQPSGSSGGNTFAGSTSDSVEGAAQAAASLRPRALGVLSLRSGRRVPIVTRVHPTGASLLTHLKPIRRTAPIRLVNGANLRAARFHR